MLAIGRPDRVSGGSKFGAKLARRSPVCRNDKDFCARHQESTRERRFSPSRVSKPFAVGGELGAASARSDLPSRAAERRSDINTAAAQFRAKGNPPAIRRE